MGYIIQSLRRVSLETGLYLRSDQGRKQIDLARNIGGNLMKKGYCVDMDLVVPEMHPEQGPVWEWVYENRQAVCNRCGGNYHGSGPGAQRAIDSQSMSELQAILRTTGGEAFINKLSKGE